MHLAFEVHSSFITQIIDFDNMQHKNKKPVIVWKMTEQNAQNERNLWM